MFGFRVSFEYTNNSIKLAFHADASRLAFALLLIISQSINRRGAYDVPTINTVVD